MAGKLSQFRLGEKTKVALRRIGRRSLEQLNDRGIEIRILKQHIVQDVGKRADPQRSPQSRQVVDCRADGIFAYDSVLGQKQSVLWRQFKSLHPEDPTACK